MFKHILLIFLISANTFAFGAGNNCGCFRKYNEPTRGASIVMLGLLGVGVFFAAPLILPASALAGIATTKISVCATVAKAGTALASAGTAGKIGLGLTAVKYVRPYILQTTEEKLKQLKQEKASKMSTAKEEFATCLRQNKVDAVRNSAGRPTVCEEKAFAYALAVGCDALDQRTKAFKDGKCFCY